MNILFLESELRIFAGMMILPLRCAVIKTTQGILLISPTGLSKEQLMQIAAVGKVTDIIAPSLTHHIFINKTHKLFPEARIWGPPGCHKKLLEIPWTHVFERDPWPYASEVEIARIQGMPKVNEIVFLEKASKTLITVDLFFNLRNPRGWGARFVFGITGTYNKFAVSRMFATLIENKMDFKDSIKKVLTWDFEKIAMAHGEILSTEAKPRFLRALWERRLIVESELTNFTGYNR